LCFSKIGCSSFAPFWEISSTSFQPMASSVACGISRTSSAMRSFHRCISFFSTSRTIDGLQVAPTAPSSIEAASSPTAAESFHKQVGVVWVISCRGLL